MKKKGLFFSYLDGVIGVECEAVVNSGGENDEVAGLEGDSNPTVLVVPHVEVTASFEAVPDFFVLVYVFRVEVLELLFEVVQFLGGYIKNVLW